jgi:hypothetical protein
MPRIPLRIVLLSLGVLFGFGSAIAHSAHSHGYHGHWHDRCHHEDRGCERDCR